MNPFVFIVGCPRSGTTLLQRLVDAHPHLAIIHETHWIPKFYQKATQESPETRVTPELLNQLRKHPKFKHLGIPREELQSWLGRAESVKYAAFVTAVFDHFGRKRGKPLVGDKTPAYARSVDVLHALWPRTRFVHLIRDGRDVCLSAVNWREPGRLLLRASTWKGDADITAALWWEWHVRLARQSGQRLGPELYCEVRYEALVNQPAEECLRLCAFLGVPYDADMLRFHEGRTRTEAGLDPKEAWLPVTPGLRDWRTQMPDREVERFEAATGHLLDELGYLRAFPAPSPDAKAEAARVRDVFIEDVRSPRRPLPEHLGPAGSSSLPLPSKVRGERSG
jgi:hypothetical protein